MIYHAAAYKHVPLIEEAGAKGAQILCLQEIFYGPYFCAEQDIKWYQNAEPVPGPTTERLAKYAQKYRMVMVIPVYEMEMEGVYYNTAAVVDADGTYLGKFRKIHIPHTWPGFWEKFYFKPGNLGFPVFETAYAKIGIYICYDRNFPECARLLALKGAEILFNPSATTSGKSQYLWQLEQPAQAVANGVFIGANNRIGLDVALIQVSPPDRFGYCSLGVSIDITRAGMQNAKLVIAQVNPRMPRTGTLPNNPLDHHPGRRLAHG